MHWNKVFLGKKKTLFFLFFSNQHHIISFFSHVFLYFFTKKSQGFVDCPICSKSVPSFYINSHVDQCLGASGGAGGGSNGAAGAPQDNDTMDDPSSSKAHHHHHHHNNNNSSKQQPPLSTKNKNKNNTTHKHPLTAPSTAIPQGPFIPLSAPSRLVPSLATEKTIRAALKKYNLPTEGKKTDLLDRYDQFRLTVATANDRQERTTYNKLAQRVVAQEKKKAAANLLSGKNLGSSGGGGSVLLGITGGGVRSDDGMSLVGCGFKELIAVTKARDAVRRAARRKEEVDVGSDGVDVGAEIDEMEQDVKQREGNEGEEGEELEDGGGGFPSSDAGADDSANGGTADAEQQQQQLLQQQQDIIEQEQHHPNPSMNQVDSPFLPHITAEKITTAASVAILSKEEMMAEELRQAREIELLDTEDDDDW